MKVIAYVMFSIPLLMIFCLILRFYNRKDKFPIRERAPKLAILQAISFTLIIAIPLVTEIVIDIYPDIWCTEDATNIPISRRLLKALYTNFRIMSYVVFAFRILVVYNCWMVDDEVRNAKSILFSNEKKIVQVRVF